MTNNLERAFWKRGSWPFLGPIPREAWTNSWIILKAVTNENGTNLRSAGVLQHYRIAASTMHKTLKALDDRGVVREEETIGAIRYRLEDSFFAHWLRAVQVT